LENKIAASHYGLIEASITNVIKEQEVKKPAKVINTLFRKLCYPYFKKGKFSEVQKHIVARLLICEIVILSTLMINKSSIY
jgi:hypothetical protein